MTTNNGKLTLDEIDYSGVIDDIKKEYGDEKIDEIIKNNTHEIDKTWIHYAQIAVSENLSGAEDDLDRSTIGTILSSGNEYFQRDYVNENTNIILYDRDEKENNGPGFDHLSLADLKYQGKFRGGKSGIEIQNNRRSNGINETTSKKTGKVPYRVTEFDMALITIPKDKNDLDYHDLSRWYVIAIPMVALVNLDDSIHCIPSLPATGARRHKIRRPFPITIEHLFEYGAVSKYGWQIYENRIAEVVEYAENNADSIRTFEPQRVMANIWE